MSVNPNPHYPWTRDGHRITMHARHGGVEGELVCPGEGRCGNWIDGECHIKLFAEDAGFYDFAEWQKDEGEGYREVELPCDIEWMFTGWEDSSELWWRPVEKWVSAQQGMALIMAERMRQITTEGFGDEHDDEHKAGELVAAAIAYAAVLQSTAPPPDWWPWEAEWWKPASDRVRNLVKAGALLAAEIDRRMRGRD